MVDAISGALAWLFNVIFMIFSSLWDMVIDLFLAIIDMIFVAVAALIGAIDISGITFHLGIFNQIPPDVLQVLAACGFASAFSIIATALVIRFTLQLIPFVRLGS